MFVVVERDSDGDIVEIVGPFPDLGAGMKWLREIGTLRWAKNYEEETGYKALVGFFGNGASEGCTCTYWLVKPVGSPDQYET